MSIYVKRGGNGGRRAGAGRPKGAIAKKSKVFIRSLLEEFPITPLAYFLEIVNNVKARPALRFAAAKAAAPYMHPRLASIAVQAETKWPIDARKLTEEELAQLEPLLLKSQSSQQDDELFRAILPPTVKPGR